MTERASDDPLVLAGRLRQAREPFALATVVGVVRPASARVGNRALISQDGTVHGWIGGACSEPAVVLEALRAIQDGRHRLVRVSRGGEGQADDGAIMAESSCASDGVVDVFVEPQLPTPLLVVVGTSPTAETLVTLASGIGWETAREAHASADAVVVATMGHGDADVLAEVLVSQADYVGLVASARRARAVTAELRSRGLPDELLARVRSPAGLDLGPGNPAEIAVAILAELVAWRTRERDSTSGLREVVDPVCEMAVAATATTPVAESAGVAYYFCSQHCRAAFEREPGRYTTVEQR